MGETQQLIALQYAQSLEELENLGFENRSLRVESLLKAENLEKALKESEASRLNLEKLLNELQSAPAPLTGAADRVKQQLSYRLGSLIVSDAGSPFGFICLPLSLVLESLRYGRENRGKTPQDLPPLHEYADVEEANRVKRQLSYRLGNTLVRRSKSPVGWLVLPFALIRQIQAFRRSRAHS